MNIQNLLPILDYLKYRFGRFAVITVLGLALAVGLNVAFASPVLAQNGAEDASPTITTDEPAVEAEEAPPNTEVENSIHQGVQCGVNLTFGEDENCEEDNNADEKIGSTLGTILNAFSVIAGVATIIMVIYAGFRYIVSGGEEKGVMGAKKTMIYAIVGVVLVILAQTIVNFVLNRLTE